MSPARKLPQATGISCLCRTPWNRQETIMKKTEWTREVLTTWPSYEYVKQKESAGWRLSAVEWQREADAGPQRDTPEELHFGEEIPYGTRIAGDCLHLEENPSEMEVLNRLAEMVVQDLSYTRMADALNQREFRTRDGKPWTPLAVFKLTPRLIEVAPRILSGAEWENRKKHLARVAWNS
jgi:Recombinase